MPAIAASSPTARHDDRSPDVSAVVIATVETDSAAAARRHGHRRFRPAGLLLAIPAILFLAIFFVLPMAAMVGRTFSGSGWAIYGRVLMDPLYSGVFLRSVWIAAQVTLIDLIVAYPLAYYLTTLSPRARLLGVFFVLLPFWSSQLVRTYAWTVILGRNGVINQVFLGLGIVDEPLRLLNTELAVLLGSVHVMLPFMVLPLFANMMKIDPDLLRAAGLFGAGIWKTFLRVHLPLCRVGIAAGVSLVFIITLGSFTNAAVLGGGRVIMIALLIEQQVRQLSNWAMAGALATVLLVVTLVIHWAANRLIGGPSEKRSVGL